MPSYKYAIYNPGQYPQQAQDEMDRMSADGWHAHTAMLNYNELYVFWERDGSALANRVAPHLAGAQVAAPQDDPELVPVDPDAVPKTVLQDMARDQGVPVSGTKAEIAQGLAPVPPDDPAASG